MSGKSGLAPGKKKRRHIGLDKIENELIGPAAERNKFERL
jgi:hypothetical protein